MIYILSGADDYSVARALEEIKKGLGDPAALEMATTNLDGRQLAPEELKNTCETVPFLMGKRLVIVEGLLERFEPSNRPRRQRRGRSAGGEQDGHKPFIAAVENVPESTILALVEGNLSGANPLYKEIAPRATLKVFPLLKEPQLREWVQKSVTEEGSSISPRAVQLLARLVGSNLWAMDSEVKKLALFARDRRIEEEDINKLVGYSHQSTVFNMVDAILEFKAELAEQSLQQLLQQGASPTHLLSMLARQVQLMLRARELRGRRLNNTEIQSKLGLTSDFVLRKVLEQAARYNLPRLKEIYRRLLETDLSIKTGKYDAELALTILVAELSRGGASPVRAKSS